MPLDANPVRGAEVVDLPARRAAAKDGVPAGDPVVVEDDVGCRVAPERDLDAVDGDGPSRRVASRAEDRDVRHSSPRSASIGRGAILGP